MQGALVEGLAGCFGECAPAQLETEPTLAGVQCLTAILACLNHLLAAPSAVISLSGRAAHLASCHHHTVLLVCVTHAEPGAAASTAVDLKRKQQSPSRSPGNAAELLHQNLMHSPHNVIATWLRPAQGTARSSQSNGLPGIDGD